MTKVTSTTRLHPTVLTVGALRAQLAALPDDLPVAVWNPDAGLAFSADSVAVREGAIVSVHRIYASGTTRYDTEARRALVIA